MQPGREAPVIVLELGVGLNREKAVAIDNEGVVEESQDDHPAGVEVKKLGAGHHAKECGSAGVGVKRVLVETERRPRRQEERDARSQRPGMVVVEVGRDGAAEQELDLFVPRDDRQVFAEGFNRLGQRLQGGGRFGWVSGRSSRVGRSGWLTVRRGRLDGSPRPLVRAASCLDSA
ncbi:MAG: hypothetical protein ACJ8FY_29220 [Gemmataceae bacterium]